jgi:SAM-dependent methyltransferase
LCSHHATNFFENQFFICSHCKGIFKSSLLLPHAEAEVERYNLHRNDVNDEGYLSFAAPIVNALLNNHTAAQEGLDFGAGPSSAIAHQLALSGYNIQLYDPFFFNFKELLSTTYDYIICCEVMEHFHFPYTEFKQLRNCLKSNGKLYCMTHLYSSHIDFKSWYYKNDFTHVFFYQQETLEWIKREFGFKTLLVKDRMIVFEL